MELFEVIPERFFSVLASPARAVYAHVLFLIYDLHKQELYGISRDAVMDAAAAYLETEAIDIETGAIDVDLAAPETTNSVEALSALTPRDKAAAVLRRLQETGWLEVEQRTDYRQYVNLAEYAIRILDTLDRLRNREQTEYAGFVLATYLALTSEEAEHNPGLAIGKAYDQTQQLVRELKSLYQNIKRYTERLQEQAEPREILAMHFDDYKLQVLDRSYHRLKTTDNVSRYRPRILERIDAWLAQPGWLASVAADEVRRGRQPAQEQAEAAIQEQLAFIRNSYDQMDRLLDEIDRRNAQYAKASLEQVRYLLQSNGNTEGWLVNILQFLAAGLRAEEFSPEDAWPRDWDGLFALHSVQLMDTGSLYTPRTARRFHRPQPLAAPVIPAPAREAAKARVRQRLYAKLTWQRIDDYVASRMGSRREIRAADLGVQTVDDFVRLIYVAAYGRSSRVRYTVDLQGPRVTAASGRFEFKNIRIRRK